MKRSLILLLFLPCSLFSQDTSLINVTNQTVAQIDSDTSLKRIELLRVKGSRQILAYMDAKGHVLKITEFFEKNNKVTSSTFYYNWVYPLCIKQSTHYNAKNKSSIPEDYAFYFTDMGELAEIIPKRTSVKSEINKLETQSATYYHMAKKTLLNDPLSSIKYDKVEAFSIKRGGIWEMEEDFTKCLLNNKIETTGKVLSEKQIKLLSNLVKDTSSFDSGVAACFEPGMAFAFYSNNSIVAVIPVCLECNRLESWGLEIPAVGYSVSTACFACYGLSDVARKKLLTLCAELQLQNCKDPRDETNKDK